MSCRLVVPTYNDFYLEKMVTLKCKPADDMGTPCFSPVFILVDYYWHSLYVVLLPPLVLAMSLVYLSLDIFVILFRLLPRGVTANIPTT
jgi:hypothetical protein